MSGYNAPRASLPSQPKYRGRKRLPRRGCPSLTTSVFVDSGDLPLREIELAVSRRSNAGLLRQGTAAHRP